MSAKTKAQLHTAIDADITTNGRNEITGAELNDILNDIVDSFGVISLTYAQVSALKTASSLTEGAFYYITDRDIVVQAISTARLSLSGTMIMRNPDYANVSTLFLGVWFSAITGVAAGKLVSYDNFMWESVTGAVGTAPSGDATNWTCLGTYGSGTWKTWYTKTNSSYVVTTNYVEYDFDNDWVQLIRDYKLGNTIGASRQYEVNQGNGFNPIDKFQWGRNSTRQCYAVDAVLNNVNWPATMNVMHLEPFARWYNNTASATSANVFDVFMFHQSEVHDCTWAASSLFKKVVVGTTMEVANKTFSASVNCENLYVWVSANASTDNGWDIAETISTSYRNCRFVDGYSNFPATLDLDTDFSAGVLTIPTNLDYVGVFTLGGTSDRTITSIANLPTNHQVTFKSSSGRSHIMSPTAIAGAVAGNIVSDGGNITIVGRTSGSDEYVVVKDGTLVKKNNIIKLT